MFHLPDSCQVQIPITKVSLKARDQISREESRLLEGTAVQSIRLFGLVSKANANIENYQSRNEDYIEVYFIEVSLDEAAYEKIHKKIARLLHKLIPHHCIIVLKSDAIQRLSMAKKSINQVDKRLRVIESEIFTDDLKPSKPKGFWEALAFAQADKTHLKAFYEYYYRVLENLELTQLTGHFTLHSPYATRDLIRKLDQLRILEAQLAGLNKKLKIATQMSEKVAINTDIHHIKTQIDTLKQAWRK